MKYLSRCEFLVCTQLVLYLLLGFCHTTNVSPAITDPCALPDSFMYCDCNVNEPEEADIITCNVYLNSSVDDPIWMSIQKLTSAITFKLQLRRERLIDYFIPTQIFEKMKKLQYFYAKGGNIGTVPSFAFANSTSIDQIILENNNISTLSSYAFANMINMTHLSLADNTLQEINRNVFVNLSNMHHLSLDRNQITTVHDFAFGHLNVLEELDLQWNRLGVIAREVFAGLGKVKRLDLSHNSIQLLGDNVFSELKSLYDIDLMGNEIVSVSPTAFDGLGVIGRLNLRNNKLVEIHSTTFQPLSNLHFLDLRENHLEELNIAPIFKNFLSSGQLMVEGNRFKCQCQLGWMQSLYNLTESQVIKNHLEYVECTMPPPQKYVRHTITATSVSEDGDDDAYLKHSRHNVPSIIGVQPEQTTSYVLDSAKQAVIRLEFAKDLNCHSSNSRRNRLSSSAETSTANPVQSAATLETPLRNPPNQQVHHSSGQSLISEKSNHHHHHQNDGEGQSQTAPSSSSSMFGHPINKFHVISFMLTTVLLPVLYGQNCILRAYCA